MKKQLVFLLALFILFIPHLSFAHTNLVNSTPKDNEIVTELKEISLTFHTKIEDGSSFNILNEQNKKIPVTQIQVISNQMKGSISPSLSNGKYIVQWNIVGVDGHPIQGQYAFQVQKKESTGSTPSKKAQIELSKEKSTQMSPKKAPSNKFSTTIIVLIGLGIIVSIGGLIWILRRKSDK